MEFQNVMREYHRMCEWCKKHQEPNPVLKDCYLDEWFNYKKDMEEFEQIVMDWAKAHPRPKYPRFIDVFDNMISIAAKEHPTWKTTPMAKVMQEEIPAEVAEEYGIAPLNLCGINKYVDEEMNSEWR